MINNVPMKKQIAAVLAAAMVFTVAAPAAPAFALNYGEESIIEFDPQRGPNLSHTNYNNMPIRANGVSFATGQAGYPLTDSPDFNGIATETFGSGARPILPEFNTDINWPGYRFDGWYNSGGNKVLSLAYSFDYKTPTVYKASWVGDTAVKFPFTTMHYRDLNEVRNSSQNGADAAVWPAANDNRIIEFYKDGSWVNDTFANTPVSATYKRNIPGYKINSLLIKNNKNRRFDDASGAGTLEEAATINSATNSIRGIMPNDNLTAAFRYVPDTTKKFALRVEYVNESGVPIKAPASAPFSVEDAITASPVSVPGYTVKAASITSGDQENLAGQGVYSASTAGYDFTGFEFQGKMPNQPVTVTYVYEIDRDYRTSITVNVVDNHHNILVDPPEYFQVSPTDPVVISVPNRIGYVYPPNISWEGNFSQLDMNVGNKELTFMTDISGGSVTLTYSEDLNDTSLWTRIEYYDAADGTLTGDTSPKSKRHGTYSIEELTQGVIPSPNETYMFDGWYQANAVGNGKTGDRLTGNVTLSGQGYKLFANFVEDPDDWFDLTLTAGSHGRIRGVSSMRVPRGTTFGGLNLPVTTADDNYRFAGWYDEHDNMAVGEMPILSSQRYTAKFTLISGGDDGILNIPHGQGSINNNGTGSVKIMGPNEFRKYVLTDKEGNVIKTMTGNQALTNQFEPLSPSTDYYLYEISQSFSAIAGSPIANQVDPAAMSQPAMVIVPAIGNNYTITDHIDGTVKVTIKPAAPNTVYSILDQSGNQVELAGGDENGWMEPSGNPLTVILPGLEANTGYTVVAKSRGDWVSAQEQLPKGSRILTESLSAEANRNYFFKITNGGYIESVTRNGHLLPVGERAVSAELKAGDEIKINAEESNGSGQLFKQWNLLLGNITIGFMARRNQTITMTGQDTILQAGYGIEQNLPISKATVEYTPKNGNFALNTDGERLNDLLSSLTNHTDDSEQLANGHKVTYLIKFEKTIPIASESNAVKALAEGNEETVVVPWALVTSMTRQVEGVNKPIPEDGQSTPAIEVYGRLENGISGCMNYQLWSVKTDETGLIEVSEIPMTFHSENEEEQMFRLFSFETNVGDQVLLSYSKTNRVKIYDRIRNLIHIITLKTGSALEDADEFMDDSFHEDYTDPVSGITFQPLGLGTQPTSQTFYNTGEAITKNLTLYAIYRQTDESDWQEAKNKLQEEIDIANALKNNGSVSAENREILDQAVNNSVNILNRIPRSTLTQLENAYQTLKDLVDNIRNNLNPDGDNPGGSPDGDSPGDDNPDDNPDGDNPGGKPSGGGVKGGGSGGSSSIGVNLPNGYRTYTNGSDGNWNTYGASGEPVPMAEVPGWKHTKDNGDIWEFHLNDGSKVTSQWINIRYLVDDEIVIYTYHFDEMGRLNEGWFLDTDGKWYFLSTNRNTWLGHMVKGWYFGEEEKKWYYMNQFSGYMLTGWQKIDGVWYYLTPYNDTPAWAFDELTQSWIYVNPSQHPLGSLYQNEETPDGYQTGKDGELIRETPN